MSDLSTKLVVTKERINEMPVSSEYLSDLVLDLNISAVERSLHTLDFNKQFALDVANGMCAVCCEWDYCLCDCYLD